MSLLGTRTYLGLSLPLTELALTGGKVATFAFAIKLGLSVVTIGSGFVGGEIAPLLCVGACLGATLANVTSLPALTVAPLALVAVFASASHTPLTCSLLAIELFGWGIAAPVLATCVIASAVSGRRSLYGSQRVETGPGGPLITMAELAKTRNEKLASFTTDRFPGRSHRDRES